MEYTRRKPVIMRFTDNSRHRISSVKIWLSGCARV